MNYERIYNRLIERSKLRKIDSYTERHHIIPRCMGGGNESSNLARLTPEEHFLAHQLLVKIHPDNSALVFALNCMVRSIKSRRANNKLFGWMRRKVSKAMREMKLGIPRTPVVRAKLSAANMGKPLAIETRAKMSKVRKGRKYSATHSAAISKALMGNKPSHKSQEKFRQMLAARTPEQVSAAAKKSWETRRKQGKPHPLSGRKLSDTHKRKIGESGRGKRRSAEAKEKMRRCALLREKKRRESRIENNGPDLSAVGGR